ncbi:MAG: DUF2764 family protein [Rikenellaceae bacterium]
MFSNEYICLVAGLHEYTLDSDSKNLQLESILEEVFDEFSKSDAESVRLLYGYYDCENIAAAHSGRTNYNPLGLLSRETLAEIIRGDEEALTLLPSKVADVVAAYSSSDGNTLEGGFERALFAAYFAACGASKSRFLRGWSEADCNLRNVAAALTARVANRPIESVVVGENGVVDQLLRSSAVDFGLRGELSYLDAVISAVSDEPNMVEKERKIDLVRWTLAEELAEGEYFSADFVLAYLAKVNIVARWRALDPERGREMFDKLMAELSGKDLVNN